MTPAKKQAFESAYTAHSPLVFRVALSHLKNREDAEDVLHDVFIKFMEKMQYLSDEEHQRAWLVRVTVNACRDALRKRSYREHLSLDEISEQTSPEQTEKPAVFYALEALPEQDRTVILLHDLEGYPIKEVASMLGIGLSAAKMRLSRARERLKKQMEGEGEYV